MIFDNRINKKRYDENKLRIIFLKIILNNKCQNIYNQDLKVQSIY